MTREVMGHHESDVLLCMEKDMERKKDILTDHRFLYMTEFFSNISVMAVELGASRLLAPYFSSSQIVWTIIIGTIMIAMALGNVSGGKWADPDRLYRRILFAAIWIAAIPWLGWYLILAISGAVPCQPGSLCSVRVLGRMHRLLSGRMI